VSTEALGAALAAWDERCSQSPDGQPTRRVPNLDVTLRLEDELARVAAELGCSTYALRDALRRERFEGHDAPEAVKLAVARMKENDACRTTTRTTPQPKTRRSPRA
jgi:hypothetical protein